MTSTPLAPLAPLLAEEPALRAVINRDPVVAVPTRAEAERLTHDLAQFLPSDEIEEFPAWETLPFERVSPSVETMGRRLRVMWRLRHGQPPTILVAPARALLQRLGPHVEDVEPVAVRPGDRVDRDAIVEQLVAMGYRREYQVEARGEVAVRGSIVDVYPSTDDHPLRIDLWDDEVERLAAFSVADQRTTYDVDDAWIFPARELLPTEDVRARAAALVREEPWGAPQWERLAEGLWFDGMESWLPWLTEREHLLTDLLDRDALVLVCEPRRLRDRAQELLDDEASLAETLAATWGARGVDAPRLTLSFDRLFTQTAAGATNVLTTPETPDTPALAATGFDPVVGATESTARRLAQLRDDGYRVVLAADGTGSAGRLSDVLHEDGVESALDVIAAGAIGIVVAPLERGAIVSGARVALVSEADLTGRRRVHRRPRGSRRSLDLYEDLAAGDYVVHHHHGVARFAGMVTRAIGGAERDYLLLEY